MIRSNSKRNIGMKNVYGGSLSKTGLTHNMQKLMGVWNWNNFKAISVIDCDKLRSLFTLPSDILNRLERNKTITDKYVSKMIRDHQNDKGLLKELDRLLFGGGLAWNDSYQNLITNEGLDHTLDVVLSGGTQDTSWFVGLLVASPTPLATWSTTQIDSNDFVAYDEATLQAFVDGGVSSQSVDNSGSPAAFSINANGSSIGGGYLIGTNAKGTAAGVVFSAGAFTGGNKAADDGDTLEVTITYTAADA